MPIQCNIHKDRRTTSPARWVVGRTENAVAATTGKNIMPPTQTMRASSMRKRRKDMAEHYAGRPGRKPVVTGKSGLWLYTGTGTLSTISRTACSACSDCLRVEE